MRRFGWVALWVGVGCSPAEPPCACDRVSLPEPPISDLEGFAALVRASRPILYPDLDGVPIRVELLDEVRFFQANVDLATVTAPPRERQYLIQVDPVVFDDPPTGDAFLGLVAHELGHVQDYVGMDTEELVEFALWYLGGDVAEYERATDEKALELGCASGLVSYWDWLETHVDAETLAAKERNYLLPAEIASWAGTCRP